MSQLVRNIPEVFAECFLSVAMFRASREHLGNMLKEIFLKKILDEKVVFMLKVYDLTITNVDLLGSSSNHKTIFSEYSKNISQIFVSKIFQGYHWNIARLWKYIYGVKKFKILFCRLSCKIFNIGSLRS